MRRRSVATVVLVIGLLAAIGLLGREREVDSSEAASVHVIESPSAAREPTPVAFSEPASPVIAPAKARPWAPMAPPIRPIDPVGAEGYGPLIERALSSGDPRLAQEAGRLLGLCRTRPGAAEQEAYLREHLSPQQAAVGVTLMQDMARKCQTVTASMFDREGDLLRVQVRGGVVGAAAHWIAISRGRLAPPDIELAVRGLEADLMRGSVRSAVVVARGGEALGISRLTIAASQQVVRDLDLPLFSALERLAMPSTDAEMRLQAQPLAMRIRAVIDRSPSAQRELRSLRSAPRGAG